MKSKTVSEITDTLNSYLELVYRKQNGKRMEAVYAALQTLLAGNYQKYNIKSCETLSGASMLSPSELQAKLSKVNEFGENRKQRGAYYTPRDVTDYIIVNTFINYIFNDNSRMYNVAAGCDHLLTHGNLRDLLLCKVIFDPTCGAGEFLINAYRIKIRLLERLQSVISEEEYLDVLHTVKGNDSDEESTDICKIRMFIETLQYVSAEKAERVAEMLNANFSNSNFVMIAEDKLPACDIIVGNPPYVEYSKMKEKPVNKYGNIYADVLKNSLLSLRQNGVYGLIVPLSYVATSRMQGIRNFVEENTSKQFILSFADRPDCLFAGVHQKLCIIYGVKSRANHVVYTSNYRHWYKAERQQLLNGCGVIENQFRHDGFIPKIGNETERGIFRKVFTNTDDNIYRLSRQEAGADIFLNMRATFYVKAFSYNPGSKEYKCFVFDAARRDFILCLLNSSLYFLFWTIISDCWHITTKELRHMYVPNAEIDRALFTDLAARLEKKLESTKKYIGTVQTDYEYKHKECFDILNEIDSELAQIYELTEDESRYVKNFAYRYRMGGGAEDEGN